MVAVVVVAVVAVVVEDACYDRGSSFHSKWFLSDVALPTNPNSSGKTLFFCMLLVVCLGRGIFHLRDKKEGLFFIRDQISFRVKKDVS